MQQQGTVIECADGVATVRVDRSEACEGCTVCGLSESGVHMIARAVDRVGVTIGDRVRIETRGVSPGRAGALLFLLPLAFLFGGYGAGAFGSRLLGAPGFVQPAGAACAVLFLFASFGVLFVVTGRRRSSPDGVTPESIIVEKL